MGTHPIFESDFDCLTANRLSANFSNLQIKPKRHKMELFSHPISPPARACEATFKFAKVDFKLTDLDLFKGEQNTPEFLAINPAHCVPTLKDGDFAIWESRAIMQYICNKSVPDSSLYPSDPKLRAKVDFLLNWDLGELYASIMTSLYPTLGFRPMPKDLEAENKKYHDKLQFMNDHLIKGKFLTGDDVTIADISIAMSLSMPTLMNQNFDKYQKVSAWLKTMNEFPEMKEVDARFQPARAAMQEKLKKDGKL